MKVQFNGQEWECTPVMIREHVRCYETPVLPIPDPESAPTVWMMDAVRRIKQEVAAAKKLGEEGDWADAALHLSVVYNGVHSTLIAILENYLSNFDRATVEGEIWMTKSGEPAYIYERPCDNPLCQNKNAGDHTMLYLKLGGDEEKSNYFPAEWMRDGTPVDDSGDGEDGGEGE